MTEGTKNALAIIDAQKNRGAITYISREDCMAVTPLYKPEVTVIQLRLPQEKNDPSADVYDIQGKFMPKREIVDRIAEASGLVFMHETARTWTQVYDDDLAGKRTVYISEQQGKRRLSDGSWRTSSVQAYEFDPVLRAMVDYGVTELNAQTKQQKDRWGKKTLAQTILEYTKVARQRAETGARLRVIRELTNMPVAFSKADAAKPLIFGRFAQNTDYILQTPEGRVMASAQALGVDVASIFGERKIPISEQTAELPDPAQKTAALPESTEAFEESETQGFAEEVPPAPQSAASSASLAGQAASPSGMSEFDELTMSLEELTTSYKDTLNVMLKSGLNPYKAAMDEIDQNNFNASVESRKAMIQRVREFLKIKGVEA